MESFWRATLAVTVLLPRTVCQDVSLATVSMGEMEGVS